MRVESSHSLLDALPEPSSLLGADGRIAAVNAAWSALAIDRALAGPGFAVGVDYCQRCRALRGDEVGEAVARGVGEVVGGRARAFDRELAYAPAERAAYARIEARALAGGGALVRHHDLGEHRRLTAADETLRTLLEMMPEGYWDWNIETDHVYYSDRWLSSLGYARGEVAESVQGWADLLHPDDLQRVLDAIDGYLAGRYPAYQSETRTRRKDGTYRWNIDRGRILARDASGKPTRMMGLEIDISERREAERVIEEQSRRLMDLSTPMIPISDQVVVMPLVGTIDAPRAGQVLESLLHGITRTRASVAILDITGVSLIDAHVAGALVDAARAVQLLGARVVLTGVRPDVASMLVGLGIDLGRIVVRGTLQAGIAHATGAERGAARR